MKDRRPPPSKVYLATFLLTSFGKFVERCLKNCVKLAIGRKARFTPKDRFVGLYLLQLLGGKPKCKITCLGFPGEGVGSQALMVMRAIAFARACGLDYVHTPFAEIAHADRPMEHWVRDWEAQFNFGAGEVMADPDDRHVVSCAQNCNDLLPLEYPHFNDLLPLEYPLDALIGPLNATLPDFRRKYYLNKSPRPAELLTICIHIRRGDVTETTYSERFTSTAAIVRTISRLKVVLGALSLEYRIRAFSQGTDADFVELKALGIDLFLDVDPIWTMQALVEADILITAKSLFSYVAALFCSGIVICEQGGDTPLPGWLVHRADGEFDEQLVEHQLRLLIQAKRSYLVVPGRIPDTDPGGG